MGDRSFARPLPPQGNTPQKRENAHSCPELDSDSNPWFHGSRG